MDASQHFTLIYAQWKNGCLIATFPQPVRLDSADLLGIKMSARIKDMNKWGVLYSFLQYMSCSQPPKRYFQSYTALDL